MCVQVVRYQLVPPRPRGRACRPYLNSMKTDLSNRIPVLRAPNPGPRPFLELVPGTRDGLVVPDTLQRLPGGLRGGQNGPDTTSERRQEQHPRKGTEEDKSATGVEGRAGAELLADEADERGA